MSITSRTIPSLLLIFCLLIWGCSPSVSEHSKATKKESVEIPSKISPELATPKQYCAESGGDLALRVDCGVMFYTCIVGKTECPLKEFYQGTCVEGSKVEWSTGCME